MIKTLEIDAFTEIYRSPSVKVIDARPTAAFNGWKLGPEARGGHIPGAVAFPQSWAANTYDAILAERLASKGLTPDHSIVVYGYDDGESTSLADRLMLLGYDDVAVLKGGLPEWAAHPDLEVIRLPKYRQLVHPEW
ncbi:MAG: rhodanese-like domain-containing protein, partial [Acidimicrobiia bacterium]